MASSTASRKVRIVGGGLSGVLAAFQAHTLGYRDIELHDAFGTLGGFSLPKVEHGLELRTSPACFGPPGDPARALLEARGLAFEEIENRCGSVSASSASDIIVTQGFSGPALRTCRIALSAWSGDSLADRLRAYPHDISARLHRYGQWRLSAWLDEVHESAAFALGVDQVLPLGGDAAALAAARLACPAHAELYGEPGDEHASQPRGGWSGLFAAAGRELERAGVNVCLNSLVSPRQALAGHEAGEVLVWAADPLPLLPAAGVAPSKSVGRGLTTYVFKARYAGPVPLQVGNFTATGTVSRIHLYESRGQTLLLAECLAEAPEAELRQEIHRLMTGFGGASLMIGEQVLAGARPGPLLLSMDAARKLAALRRRLGAGFAPAGDFATMRQGLIAALEAPEAVAAA